MILRLLDILLLYFKTEAIEIPTKRDSWTSDNYNCELQNFPLKAPFLKYELHRKRVEKVVNDMWNFSEAEAIMAAA